MTAARPQATHPSLDDGESRLVFEPHNFPATSVLICVVPRSGSDECLSYDIEGLTELSRLAAEWAAWLTEKKSGR